MVSRGNCEIVEVKDEPSQTRCERERDHRPPLIKKGFNKSLENDINKLFEAVSLRASKSLDLSDSRRNASKKPMRATGSHSPGIGFSAPVSLKQALRGQCISQAAEMAIVKRLSMPPASPRISEVGKISDLYRSIVVDASGSGGPVAAGGECRIEFSLVPEESTSCSSGTLPQCREDSLMKSNTQTSCSSPSFTDKPIINSVQQFSNESDCHLGECSGQSGDSSLQSFVSLVFEDADSSLVHADSARVSEVDTCLVETGCSQEQKHNSVSPTVRNDGFGDVPDPDKQASSSNNVETGLSVDSASSSEVKAGLKLRRKSRLQTMTSSPVKSSKNLKSARSTSRSVKPFVRNKNLVMKKLKVTVSTGENVKPSHDINSSPDHSSEQLICQRCQCSLSDTIKNSGEDHPAVTSSGVLTNGRNYDASKSDSAPNVMDDIVIPVGKCNAMSKSQEKGDISQSSKSSNCEFSSSTTSLSDESSLSGLTFGYKPHMSKDMRWGALEHVRKQYGFLGLSHFNLLKKLGSGDIGTVYLAELIGTNCTFAIKVMDNEFLAVRKKMPRARAESEILRMLDHPFLPTLYSQFTSDNLSCLVMDYCPGGDLHVLRQKQPGRYFPEEAARFYVAEVLLALEYLHMLGIVYRDLKPENILVRADGHIMLTDFDLSLRCSTSPILVKSSSLPIEPPRASGPCAGSNCIDPFCSGPSCKISCFTPRMLPSTARARKMKEAAAANKARSLLPQLVAEPTEARSNSFVGTHEYLAPEIIKGEGHGSAVDWWTLGVFLFELLHGKTPFKGGGNEETLENVVLQNLRFPHRPIVSFQARDLIRRLLVKEPENRLGTETGAAEIKRHPFFDGVNWALIRCAVPPQIPEVCDVGVFQVGSEEKGTKFMEFGCNGEQLEFELF